MMLLLLDYDEKPLTELCHELDQEQVRDPFAQGNHISRCRSAFVFAVLDTQK